MLATLGDTGGRGVPWAWDSGLAVPLHGAQELGPPSDRLSIGLARRPA